MRVTRLISVMLYPQMTGDIYGIVTEVVKIAVPQEFKDFPHLLRLQAGAIPNKEASQRVLEKAGFQREGLFRKYGYMKGEIIDLVVYSFLSTD